MEQKIKKMFSIYFQAVQHDMITATEDNSPAR